jgi:hypothetical protein
MNPKVYYVHDHCLSIDGINVQRRTIGLYPSDMGIIVSAAYCRLEDNFSRRIGRDIVTGRIQKYLRTEDESIANTAMCTSLATVMQLFSVPVDLEGNFQENSALAHCWNSINRIYQEV